MNFHTFGAEGRPSILLIHGGGNAWWNYLRQARRLAEDYHVILPTLDGHGEEYDSPYLSTEASAEGILRYVDAHCGGRLFFLGGVSLGGQIVMELLARRPGVAEKALIDGSICIPQPRMAKFCIASLRLGWGLLFSRGACRMQMALLQRMPRLRFPAELEALYLQDMPRLRRETLETMYCTYMGTYRLKDAVAGTTAQVEYWYGEREMACVKASARLFQSRVPSCRIRAIPGANHGTLAVYRPEEWLERVQPFLEETPVSRTDW